MTGKNAEDFEEYYKKNHVVNTYDSQREGSEYRRKSRERIAKIYLKFLEKEDEDKIIDLGCGSGYLTQFLGKAVGIDSSPGMLEVARKKLPDLKFIEASIFELPFKDNEFDRAVTHRVIGNFKEKEYRKVVKEIRRILKDKGVFVFDMGDPVWIRYWFRRFVSFFYSKIKRITGFGNKNDYYSLNKIKQIYKSEGFKIEKIAYIKHKIRKGMVIRARLDKN